MKPFCSFLIILIFFTPFLFSQGVVQDNPKIGLVLSGGGAKGIAHIGVIRELEKRGIKPDYVVGTSFGALVAGFYAIGYSPDQMEEIILNNDWDFLINDEIKRDNIQIGQGRKDKKSILSLPLDGMKLSLSSGVFSGQNILTFIEITCRDYNRPLEFDSLPIPFRCIATNIETGEEKIFSSGVLPKVMRASMSIPSVFTPFEIDGELYVDGGLVNNFPVNVVKEMGADIIIGVDVGAVLYKKEEINTIFKILEQSSSFYNDRISRQNKSLCDIYLRPDISGISAFDFEQVDEIIKRGAQNVSHHSETIDSVLRKHSYRTNLIANKRIADSLRLLSVFINTNSNNIRAKKRLIQGKLNLHSPITISCNDLSDRINQVYGSRFFEEISLEFEPMDSIYTMTLNVKETTENNFNIGARFDQTWGVNVLLRAEFRNIFTYGSLLELKGIVGQSPHVSYRYTTERGTNLGLGTSFKYDFFETYSYEKHSIHSSHNYQRAVMDLFIHSHLGNFNRIILGTEISAFSLSTDQIFAKVQNIKDFSYSAYLAYVIDNWDDTYFPSRGIKAKFRGDFIGAANNTLYTHAWGKISYVFPINDRFKFEASAFAGIANIGVDSTLYRYEIGGMENHRIDWYNSFPGLQFMEQGSNNAWILSFSPRYEFTKKNYLSYTFSLAGLGNNTIETFSSPERFYTGMSLKYSFDSMFGPLEASLDYSLQSYHKHVFVSLGFWF